MEGEGGHVQQGEQVGQPPHAVNAVAEHNCSSIVSFHEVVKEEVFVSDEGTVDDLLR